MSTVEGLIDQLQAFAANPVEPKTIAKRSSSGNGKDGDLTALGRQRLGQAAQAVADELMALQAIYGEDHVSLLAVQHSSNGSIQSVPVEVSDKEPSPPWQVDRPIRLSVKVTLEGLASTSSTAATDPEETLFMRLAVVIPPGYPEAAAPPQLQLLSRYIGSFGVNHVLFGQVLRIFLHDASSTPVSTKQVPFEQGQVVLFDGIEKAKELCEAWYEARQADRTSTESGATTTSDGLTGPGTAEQQEARRDAALPSSVHLVSTTPLVERKSTFVGHAARLDDPAQVPLILASLRQDRRIGRATHPAIYAWTCRPSSSKVYDPRTNQSDAKTLLRDHDDDGETAAGARLAHLLDLCRVENAIVVVTRWYGGILLGPDRFKWINRAARDALEMANLVDGPLNPSSGHRNGTAPGQARARRER